MEIRILSHFFYSNNNTFLLVSIPQKKYVAHYKYVCLFNHFHATMSYYNPLMKQH